MKIKNKATFSILGILVALSFIAVSFNNCGQGFKGQEYGQASNSGGDNNPVDNGGTDGGFLLSNVYTSDGSSKVNEVPYKIENGRALIYGGEVDVGSASEIQNGDIINMPNAMSPTLVSAINGRLAEEGVQFALKGDDFGNRGTIWKPRGSETPYILYSIANREHTGTHGAAVPAGLRAKILEALESFNTELKNNRVNLRIRVPSEGKGGEFWSYRDAWFSVRFALAKDSRDINKKYTNVNGHSHVTEMVFAENPNQDWVNFQVRRMIMFSLGYNFNYFTEFRDQFYNVNLDKMTISGRNTYNNASHIKASSNSADFFDMNSVLSQVSCGWADSRNCRSADTPVSDLPLTRKDGVNEGRITGGERKDLSDGDLRALKAAFGQQKRTGGLLRFSGSTISSYKYTLNGTERIRLLGRVCVPNSNEPVYIKVQSRRRNGAVLETSSVSFQANKAPVLNLPPDPNCVDELGNAMPNHFFDEDFPIRDLGITINDDMDLRTIVSESSVPGLNATDQILNGRYIKTYFRFGISQANFDGYQGLYFFNNNGGCKIGDTAYDIPDHFMMAGVVQDPTQFANTPVTTNTLCGAGYLRLFGILASGSSDNPDTNDEPSFQGLEVGKTYKVVRRHAIFFRRTLAYRYLAPGLSCQVPNSEIPADAISLSSSLFSAFSGQTGLNASNASPCEASSGTGGDGGTCTSNDGQGNRGQDGNFYNNDGTRCTPASNGGNDDTVDNTDNGDGTCSSNNGLGNLGRDGNYYNDNGTKCNPIDNGGTGDNPDVTIDDDTCISNGGKGNLGRDGNHYNNDGSKCNPIDGGGSDNGNTCVSNGGQGNLGQDGNYYNDDGTKCNPDGGSTDGPGNGNTCVSNGGQGNLGQDGNYYNNDGTKCDPASGSSGGSSSGNTCVSNGGQGNLGQDGNYYNNDGTKCTPE